MSAIAAFFGEVLSVKYEDKVLIQEKRDGINRILGGVLVLSIVIGLVILKAGYQSAFSLFGLGAFSLAGLFLNRAYNYRMAALVMIIAALITLQYNLAMGKGIQDVGVVVLPAIIFTTSIIYGARQIPIFLGLTLISAFLATILPHLTPDTYYEEWVDFAITTVMMVGYSVLAFVIVSRMERYLTQLTHKESEIKTAYESTLDSLAKALELRDRGTEGHSRNLVQLTEKLAREIGIQDEHELTIFRYGALLHDIGKLSIPDAILQKPGPLTDEEWIVMRKHPEYGSTLLKEIAYLQRTLEMVLYHHERWDGEGYPMGLKGEGIPLPARLLCVTDNWEALSVDRPYREKWPQEKIKEYLQENSGTKFDPEIVAAFLKMI